MPDTIAETVLRWRVWWTVGDARAPSPAPSLPGRCARRIATSPVVASIVPAALVLGGAALQLVQGTGPIAGHRAAGWVLSLLLTLPLLVRRRRPLTVFVVLAVVALVQWSAGIRLVADIALLIAVYTVASLYPARIAWAAAAVVQVGALLAVLRWTADGDRLETLVLLTGPLVAVVCAGIAVRDRAAAIAAAAAEARRRERDLRQAALLADARHRQRIAREMHDVVAHGLSVMVMLTEGALATADSDALATRDAMTRVADTGRDSLAEMRALVGLLRGEGAGDDERDHRPQPGVQDLPVLVQECRDAGLEVDLFIGGTPLTLSPAESLTAYRIVQEALTNVRKHAGASTVRITVSGDQGQIAIEIVDDGPSGHARCDGAVSGGGYGLTGIAERVSVHGGRSLAGPVPGGGWRVWARFPVGRTAGTGPGR